MNEMNDTKGPPSIAKFPPGHCSRPPGAVKQLDKNRPYHNTGTHKLPRNAIASI